MKTKPRCSECNKPFEPDVRARAQQKACRGCRQVRRNRLARERRWEDIETVREDERVRQRRCRNGGVDPEPPPVTAVTAAVTEPGPMSRAGFETEVFDIICKILRRRAGMPAGMSRAGFERQTLGMLRELAGRGLPGRLVTPACHGPA